MRITSLHINGFGVFAGVTLDALSPGINLFYGDNESGKSTLLAFIRAVFFGFPDGRSRENTYPPLNGNKHGGRISLLDEEENRIDIERFSGSRKAKVRIISRDGSREESTITPSVLGAENRNLFKNVFAFSLSELQSFESLNRDSIQEALYSASAGIDPQALTRLRSLLEKRNEDLYKSGGRIPGMNRILNRLTAIQNEKKDLNASVDEYDRIRSRLRELDPQIGAAEEKRMGLIREAGQLERWLGLWPEYVSLSRALTRLEGLEKINHFPARGLSRFESVKEKIEEIDLESREREEQYHQFESELLFLGPENGILQCEAEIRQLKRNQGRLEDVLQDLIALGRELAGAENRLAASLVNLGRDWTEERVFDFDLSLARREEIRGLRDRLQEVQRKAERSVELHESLVREKDERCERLAGLWVPETDDLEYLTAEKKGLDRLKNCLAREPVLDRDLGYVEEGLTDLIAEEKLIGETKISGTGTWLRQAAMVLFLAAVPVAIFFGFRSDYHYTLAVLVPLLVLLILIRQVQRRLDLEAGRQEEDIGKRLDRVNARREGLDRKREDLLSEKAGNQETAQGLMEFLSLGKRPSPDELGRRIGELEGGIEQYKRAESLKGEIADLEKKIREAGERRAEAELRQQEAVTGWTGWLEQHLLDPALSPEGALETLSLIESCREQADGVRRLRSGLSSLTGTRGQIMETVNRVVSRLGRGPVKEGDLLIAVHELVREFEKAEKDRQRRDILLKDQKNCCGTIRRLEERKKALQDELAELMERAGVEQEEEFIRHAGIYEKRQALAAEIEQYRDSLFRLTRGLEEPDRVMERMAAMNLDDLESRKALADRDLKALEERLEGLKEERARSEERSELLSRDERAGEIRYEEQTLKEELAAAAEEWSVNRLALALIRTARARFERDRQPDVIREAAGIFEQMTLGRYHSLLAPIGENNIEILDRNDTRKGIDQLSRGTAEQLYLSLRFGFIREFSKHSPALPVIMDDILVNFDPRRSEATIRGMIELSRTHQILFFTCHPETRELFQKAGVKEMFFHVAGGFIEAVDNYVR